MVIRALMVAILLTATAAHAEEQSWIEREHAQERQQMQQEETQQQMMNLQSDAEEANLRMIDQQNMQALRQSVIDAHHDIYGGYR